MRRVVCLVLACILVFAISACGEKTVQLATEPTETQPAAPKTLKVLAIGNSFSVDAMTHLYKVAEAEGVEEIVLGNFFVGACTLKQHAGFMESGEAAYRYDKCSNATSGSWVQTPNTTLLTGLLDEEWDIITMQQASHDSGLVNSYQPYLNNLIAYVQEKCPNAKIMWHMTWAYQSDSDHKAFPTYGNEQTTMFYGILNCLQKEIDTNENIMATIPTGTVIQNLRNSVIGDALTRDGYHLNNLGRLAASYTWYAVLSGHPIHSVKISMVDKTPITDQQKDLIVKAVNAALEKPQAVTSIS